MKNSKRILILIILVFIFLNFQPALTQTYKWTDDKGNIHFTDDYGKIPEKFRDRIRKDNYYERSTSDEIKGKEKEESLGKSREDKSQKEPLKLGKECNTCKIVSFSQFKKGSGVGVWRRGTYIEFAETCANITVKNDSCGKIYFNQFNILAEVIIGKQAAFINPKDSIAAEVEPGQTYQGSICFGVLVDSLISMNLY
jgi:hypothetical protein